MTSLGLEMHAHLKKGKKRKRNTNIINFILLSSSGPEGSSLRNTYKNKLSKFLQINKAPAQGSMSDHHYSLDHSPIPSFYGYQSEGQPRARIHARPSLFLRSFPHPFLLWSGQPRDLCNIQYLCVISLSRILIAMTRSVHCPLIIQDCPLSTHNTGLSTVHS